MPPAAGYRDNTPAASSGCHGKVIGGQTTWRKSVCRYTILYLRYSPSVAHQPPPSCQRPGYHHQQPPHDSSHRVRRIRRLEPQSCHMEPQSCVRMCMRGGQDGRSLFSLMLFGNAASGRLRPPGPANGTRSQRPAAFSSRQRLATSSRLCDNAAIAAPQPPAAGYALPKP